MLILGQKSLMKVFENLTSPIDQLMYLKSHFIIKVMDKSMILYNRARMSKIDHKDRAI